MFGRVASTCSKSPLWSTTTSPTTVSSTSTGATWLSKAASLRNTSLSPQNWPVWKVWPQGCRNQLRQEWRHQDLEVRSIGLMFLLLSSAVSWPPFCSVKTFVFSPGTLSSTTPPRLMKCQWMLLTSSRTTLSLWKSEPNHFPPMCTELNGFSQRSLYFLHFWNVLRICWDKKRNKRGIFLGSRPGVHPLPRGLRPSIDRL